MVLTGQVGRWAIPVLNLISRQRNVVTRKAIGGLMHLRGREVTHPHGPDFALLDCLSHLILERFDLLPPENG